MMCRTIPYEGNEPYVFFSYSHQDAETVYPLLEQITRDGYRVWYDDGNHPGDDWAESIAQHLSKCAVCLAMLSPRSAASHNCKSEINYILLHHKRLMTVMLEDFEMSLGMQLQLGTVHYLKRFALPSDAVLLAQLYDTEEMKACYAGAGTLPMRVFAEDAAAAAEKARREAECKAREEAERKAREEAERKAREEAERKAREAADRKAREEADRKAREEAERKAREEAERKAREEAERKAREEAERKAREATETEEDADDNERTIREEDDATKPGTHPRAAILLRLSKHKAYLLNSALTRIGRSEKRCDIVLDQNPYIGNHHADLIEYEGTYYIKDADSTNGTWVNGRQLGKGERERLSETSCFRLYDESFLLLTGSCAEQALARGTAVFLSNPRTRGARILCDAQLPLGRHHVWPDGTLQDYKVSRKHAMLIENEQGWFLVDLQSANGTWLNDQRIAPDTPAPLKDRDRIRLGDTHLEFGIIPLNV